MSHRVLIVDDSLTVRMDLHDAFTADGFATLLCATGAEARAAFGGDGFDAAVLDVLLPDDDGLELLTELRKLPARAGVVTVLLSTEDEVADRLAGLRTGADEYVGKPYDAGYVVARVRQLLSKPPTPADDRPAATLDRTEDRPSDRPTTTLDRNECRLSRDDDDHPPLRTGVLGCRSWSAETPSSPSAARPCCSPSWRAARPPTKPLAARRPPPLPPRSARPARCPPGRPGS